MRKSKGFLLVHQFCRLINFTQQNEPPVRCPQGRHKMMWTTGLNSRRGRLFTFLDFCYKIKFEGARYGVHLRDFHLKIL